MAGGGIVGDAVEDIGAVGFGKLFFQACEVEPAGDLAVVGRDAGDLVGLVDVSKDLAVDPFEFVEVCQRDLTVFDFEGLEDGEILGVDELEGAGAVAHDELFAIICEAPGPRCSITPRTSHGPAG